MKVYQIKMIDAENWDGDKAPIMRTKWFNKYGRRHVTRQTMFRMLRVSPKRTHQKSRNVANDKESDSPGETT